MKTKLYLFVLALLSANALTACKNTPGAMDDPAPAATVIKVAAMNQKVTGLENGVYDFEYYVRGDGDILVKAGGRQTVSQSSNDVWSQGFVRGITVSDGTFTPTFTGFGTPDPSCEFTGMSLAKTSAAQTFLKGGDISELSYAEHNGTKYLDYGGYPQDCVSLLAANGMNIVRLRLYVKPGTLVKTSDGSMQKVPEGYQDEKDILNLAQRAKKAGMQILLTLHYSDFWSDAGNQIIPSEWAGVDSASLENKVYEYTKQVLNDMKAQGTQPEYVSVGNETQAGLLYPYGACTNDIAMCKYLNAGCKAVHETCPGSKAIIHLNGAGDKDVYNWYLGLLHDNYVDYDIIGASYYPFWTNRDSKTVCEWAEYVTDKWQKDLLFMEVGYGWNPTLKDGTQGQITHNGPYKTMTREGQRSFLLELCENIKKVDNHRVLGFLYWDPIYLDVEGNGWCVGQKNVTGNSTLFDFEGNILPAFDAFKYNN